MNRNEGAKAYILFFGFIFNILFNIFNRPIRHTGMLVNLTLTYIDNKKRKILSDIFGRTIHFSFIIIYLSNKFVYFNIYFF